MSGPCTRWTSFSAGVIFIPGIIAVVIVASIRVHNFHSTTAVIIIVCTFVGLVAWSCICNCISINVYSTPPFRYFWARWTISPRRHGWEPPKEVPQSEDSCMTSHLCEVCLKLIKESCLLSGSKWIYTRRFERHDFHGSLQHLKTSSEDFCHLCSILWHSIPQEKLQAIEESQRRAQEQFNILDTDRNGDATEAPLPDGFRQNKRLMVRLWEEPNGKWYEHNHRVYMQLKCDQDVLSKPIQVRKSSAHVSLELGKSTGSAPCISMAKGWLSNCEWHHTNCKPPETPQPFVPTRLIFIGKGIDFTELRLHVTSPSESSIRYLALSHCWGGSIAYMLTPDTYDQMTERINFQDLARNFQDAVAFTQNLGFSYLWIDSLCIIQGSHEDWEREAQKMSNVYAQATCTISSCGSLNSQGGCFHKRNPLLSFPCCLISSGPASMAILPGEAADRFDTINSGVDSSPLSKRSWAFQERLLSRRIVHFGARFIFFECNTLQASELNADGTKYESLHSLDREGREYDAEELRRRRNLGEQYLPNPVPRPYGTGIGKYGRQRKRAQYRAYSRAQRRNPNYLPAHVIAKMYENAIYGYRGAFDTLRLNTSQNLPHRQQLRLHQRWFELVHMYTSGQLTVSTDRLVGISGIARAIQGGKELEYLCGLWKHHLLFDLLWCLAVGETPKPRPTTYRAPSWSWVAVEGKVHQRLLGFTLDNENSKCEFESMVEIHDAVVTRSRLPTTSAASLTDDGYLNIDCRLLLVGTVASCTKVPDTLTFDVTGLEMSVAVAFVPDVVLPEPCTELFCVEILKMSKKQSGYYGGLTWTMYGLVLRRILGDTLVDGVRYERIGWIGAGLKNVENKDAPFGYIPFGEIPIERIRIV